MTSIYLDHAATSPVLPEVAAAMREAQALYPANPASQHAPGRAAKRALEDAREKILSLLGGRVTGNNPDQLVFTSGGTEANNWAIFGLSEPQSGRNEIITSPIEHVSVLSAAKEISRQGRSVSYFPVTPQGVIDLAQFDSLLTPRTALVSLMLANNETGAIQPVREVAEKCHAQGILVHVDGVQGVGMLADDFASLGVDALTVAAHKFQGPVGIGGLVLRGGLRPRPWLLGGSQQFSLRPGTESTPLAVGMCRALEIACEETARKTVELVLLKDQFEETICAGYPAAVVVSKETPRAPHISCIAFVGLDRQKLLIALDQAGVFAASGSACESGSSEPSHVLQAMGLPKEQVQSAIRFSFSHSTTVAEFDTAAEIIIETGHRLSK
jgi:cysteine desulfurase